MSVDAELIRELAARQEGPSLDFKGIQYSWESDGNIELAKDIMAIANGLRPSSSPGYILIGVEETLPGKIGQLVGVAESTHLDDASMQQKVAPLLNRSPTFTYTPVKVDGLSIGVFEIHPGGRPFYSLRQQGGRHKLQRFEACLRVGSSTDLASPDQIQLWEREDEGTIRQQRVHKGLSQFLGFLAEAIDGNPFHWSKHALHCAPLESEVARLLVIKAEIEAQTFEMNVLQIKCVVESAHEASPALRALIPAAFQLSSEHGLIWLSINSSVSLLASLFPFKDDMMLPKRRQIKIGEDTFAWAFYELLEQLPRFEALRKALYEAR